MVDKKSAGPKGPEDDAKGQYAPKQSGGHNDGTASANPRVLSDRKKGDATFPVKKGH
ncbi:hypothetical protein [Pelagibacterium luteolum]|uniref:Uncharacterized protein n=1 Tax=Pelagibacterium luteolum TaxID=440168 RepID=A0A1G8A822_9HYPH|nr:hypothetical protein [Pelagibacterium luteolum]SDH17079.1 hypothetical protein SAMN04487974_12711 [Pelagibacterium luteolum]